MCIVHLNVSYHFKRQAVENDIKLRQYLIEQGLSTEPESINSLSPPSIIYSSNISVVQNSRQTIFPIAIKEEIDDVTEIVADDVTDICVEVDSNDDLSHQRPNVPQIRVCSIFFII